MKILMLCSKFPYPPKDGGAIAMMNMVEAFHTLGHEVTVLAMNTPKHYYSHVREIPRDIRQKAHFVAVDVDTSINYLDALSNLLFGKKSYHEVRFDSKGFRLRLEELLEKEQFDVVQMETLFMTPYVSSIRAKSSDALVVLRAHNVEHEIWDRNAQSMEHPVKRYFFAETAKRIKLFELNALQHGVYDAVLTVSKRDAGKFKELVKSVNKREDDKDKPPLGPPVKEITIGVDLKELPAKVPALSSNPTYVFYIGALDWIPNSQALDWFMDSVWPAVQDRYPELRLALAGRNMPSHYFSYQNKTVEVKGEVPDAWEFMGDKAIMIVPLMSGSGMRVKIVQGMAMGKAIVASKIAVEGIPAKSGQHLLIANSASEFVDAISLLVDSPERAQAMGENAQAFVKKNYDNLAITGGLIEYYEGLKAKKAKEA